MNHLSKTIRYGVLAVLVVTVLGAAILLRGSPGVTIRGSVVPLTAGTAVLGVTSSTYVGCARLNPTPGAHITVTDPSGKVIGSGTLGTWSHTTVRTAGATAYTCHMPFTITNLPHVSSYGFEITNVPGTIWVSDVSKPVLLNLSRG